MLLHTFHLLKGLMWICVWYTFAGNWKWICIIALLLLTVFNPADVHTFLFSLLFVAWTQQSYRVWHFWRFRGAEETRSTSQETPTGITTAGKGSSRKKLIYLEGARCGGSPTGGMLWPCYAPYEAWGRETGTLARCCRSSKVKISLGQTCLK